MFQFLRQIDNVDTNLIDISTKLHRLMCEQNSLESSVDKLQEQLEHLVHMIKIEAKANAAFRASVLDELSLNEPAKVRTFVLTIEEEDISSK